MVLKRFHLDTFRVFFHFSSLLPFLVLLYDLAFNKLIIRPVQQIETRTGRYAIIFLMLSLACTPIYMLSGIKYALSIRKVLGRYAFFYTFLHALVFAGLDYGFNFNQLIESAAKSWSIVTGSFAFLILILLAITSNQKSMIILKKKWKHLHSLVYLAGVLAVMHYFLVVKSDIRFPILSSVVLFILLALRFRALRKIFSKDSRL